MHKSITRRPYSLHNLQIFYASVVWNSLMSSDSNKLEHIQQKFAFICFYSSFLPHVLYSYTFALEKLSLHSLRTRRHHLDALFFVQAYRGLKSCTSLLENLSLGVPSGHVRDFSMASVSPSNKHCPSARCAYASNVVGNDLDIFAVGAVSLSHIL
jgi:hypothetical protein